LPEENQFFNKLGSLFGLGGNGGGWNPLSIFGLGGEKKSDDINAAQHFASIANGVNGLVKDMMKGAAKLGEELSTEAPSTTTKDPFAEGIGKLLSGFLGRQKKDDIK